MSRRNEKNVFKKDLLSAAVITHIPEPDAEASQTAIAERAYLRWLDRGCPEGSAEQDWLEAEREIRAMEDGLRPPA